jgi:hypothetical protein
LKVLNFDSWRWWRYVASKRRNLITSWSRSISQKKGLSSGKSVYESYRKWIAVNSVYKPKNSHRKNQQDETV